MSADAGAMKVKGYKEEKACLCQNPEECRGLTAAFVLLQDPRKGFVKLPKWKDDPDTQYYIERNQQRASYLRYLLPDHNPPDPTPSKNIALHHFHPKVTQRFLDKRQKEIPKTITDMEMTFLGMELNEADRVMDEYGFPTGEYIFVPNYPVNKVKEDLKRMILINRLFNSAVNEAREEQEEELKQVHERQVEADEKKLQEKEADEQQAAAAPLGTEPYEVTRKPSLPSPLETFREGPEEDERRLLFENLEKWEKERRTDYAVLLESNSSTWKGSIDFLDEGVREIARSERLVLGAAMADKIFSEAMHAISHDTYIDDDGNAVTDIRKQNKLMGSREDEWMPTDMLGSVVEEKTRLGAKFGDNAEWGLTEIGKELTVFREEMEAEVAGIAKMGDSLLREMEASEKEVQATWGECLLVSLCYVTSYLLVVSVGSHSTFHVLDALRAIVVSETPVVSPSHSHEEHEEEHDAENEVSLAAVATDENGFPTGEKNDDDQKEVRTGQLFVRTPSGREVPAEKSPLEEDVVSPLSTDTTPKGRGLGFFKSLSGLASPAAGASSIASVASAASAASSQLSMTFSPASTALRKIAHVKDVWVRESLYRAAAMHQAKVWHTCMGLLAKMSDAVKEIELERSVKLHAMLLDFLPRERRLFIALPAVPKPTLEKLMTYRENEHKMEEHIDEALHKRSRIVLRIDNDQRSSFMNRSRCKAPDLSRQVDKPMEGEAFETEMNRYAAVIERRVAAKVWKTTLAIVTADYYLHLFDIADELDISPGMSPEEAYQMLLPDHAFPESGHPNQGPRTDKILKHFTPTETINLMKCSVAAGHDYVEVTETVAGRIRDKATRKIHLKVEHDEADIWANVLSRRPVDETASEEMKAMLSV